MHMEEYKANGWICNGWLQEVAGGGLHVNKGIGDLSLASGFFFFGGVSLCLERLVRMLDTKHE